MNWKTIFEQRNKTSLEQVKNIYRSLNLNPRAKILSVVGTNGKGSVVSYVSQGLIKNNKKVGTFTSPHIFKANERIKINGIKISDVEVEEIIESLPSDIHFFATMFLVAMIWFTKNDVDVIILEAGIGGEKDTTNAIQADYGVITSIGLDHTDLLGKTLKSIAKDKAGIINQEMTFFIPLVLKQNIKKIFIDKVINTKLSSFKIVNNLSSSYKMRNKLLAQKILEIAFNIYFNKFKDPAFRTQIFKYKNVDIIIDVGHNFSAIQAVNDELVKKEIKFQNVILCLGKGKNKEGVVNIFKEKEVFAFQLNDTFWSPKELGVPAIKNLRSFNFNKNTLFIGSFYSISHICKKLKIL